MFIFFDETFRTSIKYPDRSLGALCGIGIEERDLARVADDLYKLKYKHLGVEFAKNQEIKGKDLLKNWVFKLEKKGIRSANLALASELLDYIAAKRFPVFGCVCFEKDLQKFQVEDVRALDKTFRLLFERIDTFMKIHRRNEMGILVFDDRDYGINQKNSEAITNFFQRSAFGLSMDSIVETPFFAISQSQNIGLQLADFVTTVIGLRFSSHPDIAPYYSKLKRAFVTWENRGRKVSSLKVIRGYSENEKSVG